MSTATIGIEALALSVLDLTDEDQQTLAAIADVETAAFEEYFSDYTTARALMVCKGCHGG